MNKYKLKMRTLTGLGNEYVYVYATSNFERYLNNHNLKYARDITKDYQLTDRFEKIQSQLEQKEKQLNEIKKYVENKRTNNNLEYGCGNEFNEEYDDILSIIERNNSNE